MFQQQAFSTFVRASNAKVSVRRLRLVSIFGIVLALLCYCTGCSGSSSSSSSSTTTNTSALSISTSSLLSGTVSGAFSSALQATGGTSPYTWTISSGSLPTGLSLSSAGVLSGTPTAIADSTVTFQVTDSNSQTATKQISLAIIPAGFTTTTVFDEEFNASSLDTSVWHYRTGVRDQCTQDSSATAVANGYLRLSIYTASGVEYCGAIDTSTTFKHAYGYWEAAVRYQYQTGTQCAWWLQSPTIGANVNDPVSSGVELDVFEHTSGTTSTTGFDHALHWNGYTSGIAKSLAYNGALANLNDGNFHVFGIAWTPSGYTFYVDGKVTWTLSSTQAPASSAAEYAILDTELPPSAKVAASGYGALGASSNLHLDVDYVRVYPYSAQ